MQADADDAVATAPFLNLRGWRGNLFGPALVLPSPIAFWVSWSLYNGGLRFQGNCGFG